MNNELMSKLVAAGIEPADYIEVKIHSQTVKAHFSQMVLSSEGKAVALYVADVPKRQRKANSSSSQGASPKKK